MRRQLLRVIAVPALLLLGGCTSASSARRSGGHVVVPALQLIDARGLPAWTPTEAHISACETSLGRTLAKRKRDLGTYYLRLGGVIRDGSHRIVGFATQSASNLQPASEDTLLLPPFGGGETVFRFEYDADHGKLVLFEFGAPL